MRRDALDRFADKRSLEVDVLRNWRGEDRLLASRSTASLSISAYPKPMLRRKERFPHASGSPPCFLIATGS